MKVPYQLDPQTRRLFEELADAGAASPSGWLNEAAKAVRFEDLVRGLLNGLGLPMVPYKGYLKFARVLQRLFARHLGRTLCHEVVVNLVRWQGYGLDSHVMQQMVCICFEQLRERHWRHDVAQAPAPAP